MPDDNPMETCPGCGLRLAPVDGATHAYMTSSAGCYALFTGLLAHEYSNPALQPTHRLSVDTYAVQHPGDGRQRRQVQSTGLHLARLYLQLDHPRPPRETNAVMLRLGARKASLIRLEPPARFTMTIGDVAPFAGGPDHPAKVREWARSTWADWSAHHAYIRAWLADGA